MNNKKKERKKKEIVFCKRLELLVEGGSASI
jgi:hypothetical protein